jgi:alkanesulfonate monooxygenase SsuD/methylene tetrahydromethanopterin reductase-like flavin-dependent oxidoreductase (luciferase family)
MTPAHIRNTYLLGDDESCLERLRQYVEAGADHVLLGCTPGPQRQLEDFMAASGRLLGAARSLFPSKEAW